MEFINNVLRLKIYREHKDNQLSPMKHYKQCFNEGMCIPRTQCKIHTDCDSSKPYTYCRQGFCFKNICFDDNDCEGNDKCHLHPILHTGTCSTGEDVPGMQTINLLK